MATANYTLAAAELQQLNQMWDSLTRSAEFKQIVSYFVKLDGEYAMALDGVNALAPREWNLTTGVVSVDTSNANKTAQFPFFP